MFCVGDKHFWCWAHTRFVLVEMNTLKTHVRILVTHCQLPATSNQNLYWAHLQKCGLSRWGDPKVMYNSIFQGQHYNMYSRLEALEPQPWKQGESVQTRTVLHVFYHHMHGQANACCWTCPRLIELVLPRFYLWRKTCDVAYRALSQLVQQWEGPGNEASTHSITSTKLVCSWSNGGNKVYIVVIDLHRDIP